MTDRLFNLLGLERAIRVTIGLRGGHRLNFTAATFDWEADGERVMKASGTKLHGMHDWFSLAAIVFIDTNRVIRRKV